MTINEQSREVDPLTGFLHDAHAGKLGTAEIAAIRAIRRAIQIERAAIVAWLREKAEHGNPPYFADNLADAIERGEHLDG